MLLHTPPASASNGTKLASSASWPTYVDQMQHELARPALEAKFWSIAQCMPVAAESLCMASQRHFVHDIDSLLPPVGHKDNKCK